ncbi:hypothetical protein PSQ90_16325 [Devosia rhodophyticola]|uniref:Uncharacterized protein n=1 Tax=Devosia rhodophyticola TaxID=3026423 RepID=A0ABY7YXH2_9HYPH|nr:hypothetical protein [Devosia rhodophyticola]WDR05788.1 hypothetical protein PSQ90_16325 [Devosia rhodophyticola]
MAILVGVIIVLALLALALAVREAQAMVRLSPQSDGLAGFFWLGWWKFGAIKARISPDAAARYATYTRAITTFLVLIVLGSVLSSMFGSAASN